MRVLGASGQRGIRVALVPRHGAACTGKRQIIFTNTWHCFHLGVKNRYSACVDGSRSSTSNSAISAQLTSLSHR